MRKPRNKYTVQVVERDGKGKLRINRFPAVATEEKAKELLESLDISGFVMYAGETIWQYSNYGGLLPPRWINRR